MLRRITTALVLVLGVFGLMAAPAFADHGQAHNGETAEISESEGLAQDDVVTVTGIGYAPGSTLTVVQCFIFPAAGPNDCELSNYGQFTGTVGDDGSASVDYSVNIVDGRCDADTPCFIVISDGIGAAANAIGMEVTFAAAEVEETTTTTAAPTTTTEAPTTTTEAPATTAAPATDAPATTAVAAAATDDGDDDGGGAGLIIGIIVALVAVGGLGAFLANRNKN
ncbi:MAG: neocarzinostatin apoprotein domain-containing protein [Acidimicrobiales bacterium]